jgi:hypothetical protein
MLSRIAEQAEQERLRRVPLVLLLDLDRDKPVHYDICLMFQRGDPGRCSLPCDVYIPDFSGNLGEKKLFYAS